MAAATADDSPRKMRSRSSTVATTSETLDFPKAPHRVCRAQTKIANRRLNQTDPVLHSTVPAGRGCPRNHRVSSSRKYCAATRRCRRADFVRHLWLPATHRYLLRSTMFLCPVGHSAKHQSEEPLLGMRITGVRWSPRFGDSDGCDDEDRGSASHHKRRCARCRLPGRSGSSAAAVSARPYPDGKADDVLGETSEVTYATSIGSPCMSGNRENPELPRPSGESGSSVPRATDQPGSKRPRGQRSTTAPPIGQAEDAVFAVSACGDCGETVAADAAFCPRCGAQTGFGAGPRQVAARRYSPTHPPPVPHGYAYSQPQQSSQTNPYAIAGLVLGVFWLFWVGSLGALLLGYLATRQIAQANGKQGGRSIAFAAIALGWIGIGLLILTLALMVGGIVRAPRL